MSAAGERGQAGLALAAGMLFVLGGGVALAWIAAAATAHGAGQRAADLGALAGARALLDDWDALGGYAPRAAARAVTRARAAALGTARANGARRVSVRVVAGSLPGRVTVLVADTIRLPGGVRIGGGARAVAEPSSYGVPIGDGEYPGPFAHRQGKPMRPDVALAFDRMARAAARAAIALTVVSAFRTDAEQARLFAAHPDPRWVARPGSSLHRLGTELDLGPRAAYGWLAANAGRFGFVRRYSWGFARSLQVETDARSLRPRTRPPHSCLSSVAGAARCPRRASAFPKAEAPGLGSHSWSTRGGAGGLRSFC